MIFDVLTEGEAARQTYQTSPFYRSFCDTVRAAEFSTGGRFLALMSIRDSAVAMAREIDRLTALAVRCATEHNGILNIVPTERRG